MSKATSVWQMAVNDQHPGFRRAEHGKGDEVNTGPNKSADHTSE